MLTKISTFIFPYNIEYNLACKIIIILKYILVIEKIIISAETIMKSKTSK